jgi:oxygen-independent coproporphyrinogen III oxidase
VLFLHPMLTSLYFHIPFCTTRCGYCDFNTYAGVNYLIPNYVNALCNEIVIYSKLATSHPSVHTLYFGGGTPSILPLKSLEKILNLVHQYYDVLPDAEISLEANPGSVDAGYLQGLRGLGLTRISMGMQSAYENELAVLTRKHNVEEVSKSVLWAQQAGIPHISVDLIFGIPGQTLESWKNSLITALNLPIDHVSLYSLTVEKGTLLQKQIAEGIVESPDEDLAGEMYEFAIDLLPEMGFLQYEISNWAKNPDGRSLHNMQYWKCLPYFGFGAGAHGYFDHYRYENIPGVLPYISSLQNDEQNRNQKLSSQVRGNKLTQWDEMQEFMMLGLRLTQDGISRSEFISRFSYQLDEAFSKKIEKLVKAGLIENHPDSTDRMRLTRKGILFGNRVFMEFVGNKPPVFLRDQ